MCGGKPQKGTTMGKDVIISTVEAARKLGVSRCSIVNAAKRGKLKPIYGGISGTRIVGFRLAEIAALVKIKEQNLFARGGAA